MVRWLCSYPYPSPLSALRAHLKGQLLPALAPPVPLFSLEPAHDHLGLSWGLQHQEHFRGVYASTPLTCHRRAWGPDPLGVPVPVPQSCTPLLP